MNKKYIIHPESSQGRILYSLGLVEGMKPKALPVQEEMLKDVNRSFGITPPWLVRSEYELVKVPLISLI